MKKLALLLALLLGTPAYAGVSCSIPFNIQNGTTADATQVMANYNAIVACLGNAAAAGANNDITSLSALSTPITPAQGGSTVFVGSASTGNTAIIVASTVPSNFTLAAGNQVTFKVGVGNGGATTLTVDGQTANFFRRTQNGVAGISAMVGGELRTGHVVTAEYDGTQFQLISTTPALVGEIRDFAGSTAPVGWAFIDGSCVSRTTFPDLFAVIGTTYDPTGSTCDVAHFALPDGRGRVLAGQDNMGGLAANRITNASSGCTGTTIGGAGCGSQTHTQTLSELAQHTHTDSGHTHAGSLLLNGTTALLTSTNFASTGGTQGLTISTGSSVSVTTGSGTANIQNAGSSAAMPILNPLQIVTKIIKL